MHPLVFALKEEVRTPWRHQHDSTLWAEHRHIGEFVDISPGQRGDITPVTCGYVDERPT